MRLQGLPAYGLILLWTSVFVIPLGVYLATQAPNFKQYESQAIAEWESTPGIHHGPNFFIADAYPLFTGCFCFFIGLLYSGGIYIIPELFHLHRVVGLFGASVFGLGCLTGSYLGITSAIDALRWQFVVLGIGFLLSAAGLALGGVGVVKECWSRYRSRG